MAQTILRCFRHSRAGWRARTVALSLALVLSIGGRWRPARAATPMSSSIPWESKHQGAFVTSLAEDQRGQIWAGVEDTGVWRYNPGDRKWTQYTTKDGLGDDNGYALAVDRMGRVWAGHQHSGVSVFNGVKWRNYGLAEGPLGERVFGIATCPTDGDVWIATNAGLTRYSMEKDDWFYYDRASGLPSDQISAIAFSSRGDIIVGTECSGLALASASEGYKTWRIVNGPSRPPASPAGSGLPCSLINCLLVARDGTIYAGTSCGLSRSSDNGASWDYVRGVDWEVKAKDVTGGVPNSVSPRRITRKGDLLAEDFVTCLAEDGTGAIEIGYRQTGWDVRDLKADRRLWGSSTKPGPKGTGDWVAALLPLAPGRVGAACYGGRLGGLHFDIATASRAAGAPGALLYHPTATEPVVGGDGPATPLAALPAPARPPNIAALQALSVRLRQLTTPLVPGTATYQGDDWATGGDWCGGRYGTRTPCSSRLTRPSTITWLLIRLTTCRPKSGHITPLATACATGSIG